MPSLITTTRTQGDSHTPCAAGERRERQGRREEEQRRQKEKRSRSLNLKKSCSLDAAHINYSKARGPIMGWGSEQWQARRVRGETGLSRTAGRKARTVDIANLK